VDIEKYRVDMLDIYNRYVKGAPLTYVLKTLIYLQNTRIYLQTPFRYLNQFRYLKILEISHNI